MNIQAALFDIGNVLLPFDYERALNRLMAGSGNPPSPDMRRVEEFRRQLEVGAIKRAEFLALVRREFGHYGTDEEFLTLWCDIFDSNPPLNRFVERLAGNMPLYLLSNTSCIHKEFIFARYPVFSHFRGGVYSYEVGLLKPDLAIFRVSIERLGLDPSRTLYLDDMAENCAAAERAGFVVFHYDHRNHEQTERDILALLA
jgi:putative hydrolase of the HAD superfamily